MKILIAEDDAVSRRMLEATLHKWGYETQVCNNGREALDALMQVDAPDVAILDWMMPEIDGPEVCRRLRENASECPPYVILLTARSQRDDIINGLKSGADDYVVKPYHHQELHARLQVAARITRLQRQLAGRAHSAEDALARLAAAQEAQKLEAIGRLASGIAHEINTPAQYVGDNLGYLHDSILELSPLLDAIPSDSGTRRLMEDLPKAIEDSIHGVQRINRIVRAMRDFSASRDGREKVMFDVNQAIETTVTVTTHEWKYVADVECDLDSSLPHVMGFPGEIHLVLLNLIVNAAQAVSRNKTPSSKGTIRITTTAGSDAVEIRVRDTGAGIPPEHQQQIFEPFFTTKDVGAGIGQLAVAYFVVVNQHGGRIWFDTRTGQGTTFFVQLPINNVETNTHEIERADSHCR